MADFMEVATSSSAQKSSTLQRSRPWVEKWRPERVEDVSHQDEVVKTLKQSIESGNLPHLLFHGSPGTGKTTTILAVARALYGPELYKKRILELNASDERGISVIRDKVKNFAQAAVGNQRTAGYPCPKFKLIILDEADTMTSDAQSALRRVMEAYSRVTRFCLICNYVTRVIEPLASRCAKFRFRPLPKASMVDRIQYIARMENVSLGEGALDTILHASGGDMRKAVTFLQTSHQLAVASGNERQPVTSAMVVDISGQSEVNSIIGQGYPMGQLLSQLHDDTVNGTFSGSHVHISDATKGLVCEKIACADLALADGSNEELQLLDVAAFIMRRLNNSRSPVDSMVAAH
eukprot:GSChrysophyteH1.ASY1.ANO1.463.1 assembled CDS